ncbi:hypothetical protein [Clostridium sp.]|uniref:hypothetical protein n=1 Tax=Clostridium sp. TaxID=1506 RepID=UPI00262B6A6A|nr:hypothetical protein [Clostridium sp.]
MGLKGEFIMWYDNAFSNSITYILENFYYMSGIALFLIGIRQLKSAVQIAKTRTEREAISNASQLCDRFYNDNLPLTDEINEIWNKLGFTFHKGNKKDSDLHISEKEVDMFTILFKDDVESIMKVLYATNKLEAFSTYFVKGVADSKLGFEIIGKAYCSSVRSLIPMIYIGRHDGRYPSINQLYKSWNNKLIAEQTELDYQSAKVKDSEHFKTHGL